MFARNHMHIENQRLLAALDGKVDVLITGSVKQTMLITKLTQSVDKHEQSIYGNGHPGIRDRMAKMEQSFQFTARLMWMFAPILLALIAHALWPTLLLLK